MEVICITISVKSSLLEFKKKFIAAIPVIVFFLLLFYVIILLFGTEYLLIVSFITATFKVRMQKSCTLRGMSFLLLVQLSICILAFFATLNLFLCILLNAVVPFVLIYLQTTQFNQKGYFTNAMAFVFLQLRPVGFDGFFPLLGAVLFATVFLIAALFLYSRFHPKTQDYRNARKGLGIISQEFSSLADGTYNPAVQKDMLFLQTTLHRLAYGSRDLSYVVRGEGKIHYLFALLFQRCAYFISDFSQTDQPHCAEDIKMLKSLSLFLDEVQDRMDTQDNEHLISEANSLAQKTDGLSERFSVFARNFLRLLVITLEAVAQANVGIPPEWKLPKHAHPLRGIRQRLRLDSFEIRFALRLSLVSVISFAACRLAGSDHAYWLPLNAFLLLQPMYEESAYRMKTRLIGTAIGCLLAYLILPLLSGVTGHFVFATVMISLMYCCTPGTWVQPIFATGFALSLASLTMDSSTAIEYRFLYLGLAVLLVLVVNRFFFPTSLKGQFRSNIRELFHIQSSYLSILSISARRVIDYGVVSDALISFHLLYDEVRKYLKNPKNELDSAPYEKMLSVMWRMTAEVEQMILFLKIEHLTPSEQQAVDHFSWQMKRQLQKIRNLPVNGPDTFAQASSQELSPPYLGYLMRQYQSNLDALSVLTADIPPRLLHH